MGAGRPEQPPKIGEGYVITDESWFDEWVAFGFAELVVCLAKHAAFESWYAQREDERGGLSLERSTGEQA